MLKCGFAFFILFFSAMANISQAATHSIFLDFNNLGNFISYQENIMEQRTDINTERFIVDNKEFERTTGVIEYFTQSWFDFSINPITYRMFDTIEFSFLDAPSIFFITDVNQFGSFFVVAESSDKSQNFGQLTGTLVNSIRKTEIGRGSGEFIDTTEWGSSSGPIIGFAAFDGDSSLDGFASRSFAFRNRVEFDSFVIDRVRIQLFGKSMFVLLNGEIFRIGANLPNGSYVSERFRRDIVKTDPLYKVVPVPIFSSGVNLAGVLIAFLLFKSIRQR